MQNRPPVFSGSLAAVINEDSPIGTLVMTIQAKDGDHGQPRKIVYDLLTSKQLIDYHLLLMIPKGAHTHTHSHIPIYIYTTLFCSAIKLDPMDYFLLDSRTGELHTARPLDREALPDSTGIIVLTVRVCTYLIKKRITFT